MDRKDCDSEHIRQRTRPTRLLPAMAGCVLAFCCAQAAVAGTIRIRPTALIDRDQIRLSDVAVVDGFGGEQLETLKDMIITPAPAFGQNKLVTLNDIRARLIAAGVNMADVYLKGSSRCVVRRPTAIWPKQDDTPTSPKQDVAGDQTLGAQIRRLIEQKLADYGGEVELDFGRTPSALLALSGPAYTFDVEPRTRRRVGHIDLQVTIHRGRSEPQTHKVSVTAGLKKGVVVAVNRIGRGQTISSADVLLEQRTFEKLEHIGMTDPASVIGQEAKRVIRVGEMIQGNDIKSKVLVKRSDLVGIRSVRGGIVIESTATALEKGSLGDIIEVRNEASQKSFWAQVTGLRQAEALARPGRHASASRGKGGAG